MRRLAFVACMAAIGIAARADVVTNVWINPSGGGWFASENGVYTNWQGGAHCISTNVACLPLLNGADVYVGKDEMPYMGGVVMFPAVPGGEPTNTWWMSNIGGHAFRLRTSALGYFPFNISGGTLIMGSGRLWHPYDNNDYGPLRKEGDGIIRISTFYNQIYARREFQVAEGKLIPMVTDALFWTDVRVTDPAGQFVFTNYSSRVGVGSLHATWAGRLTSRATRC